MPPTNVYGLFGLGTGVRKVSQIHRYGLHQPGVLLNHPQEHQRGGSRTPCSLLPGPERIRANAHQLRKLGLGQPQILPYRRWSQLFHGATIMQCISAVQLEFNCFFGGRNGITSSLGVPGFLTVRAVSSQNKHGPQMNNDN